MLQKVYLDAEVSSEAWCVDIGFCEYDLGFVRMHRTLKEDT